MRYVLDACVAIKWLLAEVDSDRAIRLLLTADDRLARGLPSHPIVLLSSLP